ncbi:MAG: cbb3-type cytochrome oxidase assembly protein CcoS [Burkholderiales bacterium]
MEILMLLIPLSVVLALLIGALFWWSVRSGQFDDLDGPAHRILADDDRPATLHNPAGEALTPINPKNGGGL